MEFLDFNSLLIKHFNKILIEEAKLDKSTKLTYHGIDKKTISKGFIFSNKVKNYLSADTLSSIADTENFLTGEEMNASFHKSFGKVEEAPDTQLLVEQVLHYLTTYGLKSIGEYREDLVYIPKENLNIPEIDEDFPLTIIDGITYEELKDKLFHIFTSGIALQKSTLQDLTGISTYLNFNEEEIQKISNKEIRVRLYSLLDVVPENPVDFLRLLMYDTIGDSLIIKNSETIRKIKINVNADLSINKRIFNLLKRYNNYYGRLGEIFYRFKELFLAFKIDTNNWNNDIYNINGIINKIRKQAKQYHKPIEEDYLSNIIPYIRSLNLSDSEMNNKILMEEMDPILNRFLQVDPILNRFLQELNKVDVFRKIRLLNALRYYGLDVERSEKPVLYKIRNGKTYCKDMPYMSKKKEAYLNMLSKIVKKDIAKKISKNIQNKKIFIPDNIEYALPTSEKQFSGNLPDGTCITSTSDASSVSVGVHWKNKKRSIDLDLAMLPKSNGQKIGWDGQYRSQNGDILFSGDQTTAPIPNGASELFNISQGVSDIFLITLNFFNYTPESNVPFKLFFSDGPEDIYEDFVVDPNKIIASSNSQIEAPYKVVGLLEIDEDYSKFFFIDRYLEERITSGDNDSAKKTRQYFSSNYKHAAVYLSEIIHEIYSMEEMTGKVVDDPEDADIDLSFNNIEKDTIINLLI